MFTRIDMVMLVHLCHTHGRSKGDTTALNPNSDVEISANNKTLISPRSGRDCKGDHCRQKLNII